MNERPKSMSDVAMSAESLRVRLYTEHLRLHALFKEVIARLEEDDRDETTVAWDSFESGLLAHMDFEERELLPAFREAYPSEAAKVLIDHASFRTKLIELAIAVDLHFVRAIVAREFIQALEIHAERENSLMYTWAAAELGDELSPPT